MVLPETDMRSVQAKDSNANMRLAWEPPVMTEVPIAEATKATGRRHHDGQVTSPPAPASPSTKLGFAFEMSFPLSARTE
jgi:hypothetical protein